MKKTYDENKKIAMDYINKEIEVNLEIIARTESCLENDPMFSERNYRALINNTCLKIITLFDTLYDCCFTDDNFYINDLPLYKCFEYGFRNKITAKQKSNKARCDYIDNNIPVSDLELSVRAANALKCNDIKILSELLESSERELCKMPNLGKRCLDEIKNMLKSRGLELSPVTRARI